MESYFIGLNILKQCLFGIGFCGWDMSICFACFSVEIFWGNRKTGKFISCYNGWAEK